MADAKKRMNAAERVDGEELERESAEASPVASSSSAPSIEAAPVRTTDWGFLPIPPRLRRDRTHELDLGMLVIFGLASTVTVVRLGQSLRH